VPWFHMLFVDFPLSLVRLCLSTLMFFLTCTSISLEQSPAGPRLWEDPLNMSIADLLLLFKCLTERGSRLWESLQIKERPCCVL
jgi:hypothetical protein